MKKKTHIERSNSEIEGQNVLCLEDEPSNENIDLILTGLCDLPAHCLSNMSANRRHFIIINLNLIINRH